MTTAAVDTYARIRRDVLDRLERDKLDPAEDVEGIRHVVDDVVHRYQAAAHLGQGRALRDPADMASRILSSITGFGPFTELFSRTDIEEIFIEGPRVTYIAGDGRLTALEVPTTEDENRQILDRLLATTQRNLDAKNPMVQARVLDGSARLTAAIPPVSDQLSATIRRHIVRHDHLRTMVERGALNVPAASFLHAVMQASTGVVVSGPPGAGKTTLLSSLLSAVPTSHCVRCCEEIRELHTPLTHGAFYETRPPAVDGSGEITLRDLVKFTLAMRPDRIVVGEVRGAEAFELTRAVNAGCGFACTVHANSARDALVALVNAAIMAGENVSETAVRKVLANAIDVVVHCDRQDIQRDGRSGILRQVTEILAVVPSLHDDFTTEPIFVRDGLGAPLRWTGIVPPAASIVDRALPSGVSVGSVAAGRSCLV